MKAIRPKLATLPDTNYPFQKYPGSQHVQIQPQQAPVAMGELLKYGGRGMIDLLKQFRGVVWHEWFVPPQECIDIINATPL